MEDKTWANTVCLDFDGVIAKFGTEDAGEPVEGVFDGLLALVDAGWWIEIYSGRCATDEGRKDIEKWLLGHGAWFFCQLKDKKIVVAKDKPTAKIYVDDRGMVFKSWQDITPDTLERFRAWWQHPASTE